MQRLVLTFVFAVSVVLCQERPQFRVTKEWNFINFTFKDQEHYQNALSSKEYIPYNVVAAGINYYNGYFYVSLPRMKHGVPATLTRIPSDGSARPLFEPFPSWELNKLDDCEAIQNSQNVEIDKSGQMWIIDGGRTSTLEKEPKTTCAPKLIIYDINEQNITRVYHFPESVINSETSFLYDLVVDDSDGGYAFITDNSAKDPGIVVYSLLLNRAWKIRHPSMRADEEVVSFNVDNVTIKKPINIAGIALGPKVIIDNTSLTVHDDRSVFYCPISSTHLYSIKSSELRNMSLANSGGEFLGYVEDVGRKAAPTDGMIMDDGGVLYYGLLSDSSIAKWNSQTPFESGQTVISRDANYILWPNSFTFDNDGNLVLLSNTLHKFIFGKMEIREPNFRVMSIKTGSKSYMAKENTITYSEIDTSDASTEPADAIATEDSAPSNAEVRIQDRSDNESVVFSGDRSANYMSENDSASLSEKFNETEEQDGNIDGVEYTRMRDGSLGTVVSGFDGGRRDGIAKETQERDETMDGNITRMSDGSLGTVVSGFEGGRRDGVSKESEEKNHETMDGNFTRMSDGSLGTVVSGFEGGRRDGPRVHLSDDTTTTTENPPTTFDLNSSTSDKTTLLSETSMSEMPRDHSDSSVSSVINESSTSSSTANITPDLSEMLNDAPSNDDMRPELPQDHSDSSVSSGINESSSNSPTANITPDLSEMLNDAPSNNDMPPMNDAPHDKTTMSIDTTMKPEDTASSIVILPSSQNPSTTPTTSTSTEENGETAEIKNANPDVDRRKGALKDNAAPSIQLSMTLLLPVLLTYFLR